MSECNYCTISRMKKSAQLKGKRVVVIAQRKNTSLAKNFPKGVDIHLLGKGEKPSRENWVAWLAELLDHCVC